MNNLRLNAAESLGRPETTLSDNPACFPPPPPQRVSLCTQPHRLSCGRTHKPSNRGRRLGSFSHKSGCTPGGASQESNIPRTWTPPRSVLVTSRSGLATSSAALFSLPTTWCEANFPMFCASSVRLSSAPTQFNTGAGALTLFTWLIARAMPWSSFKRRHWSLSLKAQTSPPAVTVQASNRAKSTVDNTAPTPNGEAYTQDSLPPAGSAAGAKLLGWRGASGAIPSPKRGAPSWPSWSAPLVAERPQRSLILPTCNAAPCQSASSIFPWLPWATSGSPRLCKSAASWWPQQPALPLGSAWSPCSARRPPGPHHTMPVVHPALLFRGPVSIQRLARCRGSWRVFPASPTRGPVPRIMASISSLSYSGPCTIMRTSM